MRSVASRDLELVGKRTARTRRTHRRILKPEDQCVQGTSDDQKLDNDGNVICFLSDELVRKLFQEL
jgi:hypothetical protein